MISEQLTLIEDLTSRLEGTEFIILRTEYLLTKYEIAFFLWFRNTKNRKAELKKKVNSVKKEILYMKSTIKEKCEEYPFLISKINLRIASHNFYDFSLEDSEVANLEECVKVFEKFKSWKLAARTQLLLAKIYKNEPEQCLKWASFSEKLSIKIHNKKLTKDSKKLIENSKKAIRKRYQNKLVFLNSEPLNGVKHYSLLHDGLNYKEDLKNLLMDNLVAEEKSIAVQFDILTREILDEIFTKNKGCKLLVLDSSYSLYEKMVLEGPHLTSKIVTFEFMDLLLTQEDKDVHFNVEIFVDLSSPPIPQEHTISNKS